MMKLNNKGFAITSIIYSMLVLFLALVLLIMSNLASRKLVFDKQKSSILESINTPSLDVNEIKTYTYVGYGETWDVTHNGNYKIELWGASGGLSLMDGVLGSNAGKGGYASGTIYLRRNDILYVYVGGQGANATIGSNAAGGYNGGGLGTWDGTDNEASGGGGGATDIRLIDGEWNDSESLASRIIVAGGGGGSSYNYIPGNGGGLSGTSAYASSPMATQTSGYLFGIGQDGSGVGDSDGVAGGGGGYWGGRTADVKLESSGAGGSGYVSGHPGCIAINSQLNQNPKVQSYSNISDSYHYSGYKFVNTSLIAGDQGNIPTYDGNSTMMGNTGNGYVKITYLGQ